MLYTILGSGVGLSVLLLYLRYTIKTRENLKKHNEILEEKKDYRDEVINQLSKPITLSDVIDQLRKGKF